MIESNIFDLYSVRHWGIKFASDAAISILKVDQVIILKIISLNIFSYYKVIMARPAGGVAKPKQPGAPNEE